MHRRGLTLIELLVVIAIVTMLWLVFAGMLGTLRMGDELQSTAGEVRAMAERGRSQALARNARFELLVDFEHNRITALERRPVMFFSFEDTDGAFNSYVRLRNGALIDRHSIPRMDGNALAIAAGDAGGTGGIAEIQYDPRMTPQGNEDGISVSFDLRPEVATHAQWAPLISQGGSWRIEIGGSASETATFRATVGTHVIEHEVVLPSWQWGRVELIVSPLTIRLYVNGMPAAADMPTQTNLNWARGAPMTIGGGTPGNAFLMDNLRLEQLNASAPLTVPPRLRLLPPGASPSSALDDRIFNFAEQSADRTVVPPAADDLPPMPPMPLDSASAFANEPVRQALVFFDHRGGLDLNFHRGPVRLMVVGPGEAGQPLVQSIEFAVLGETRHRRMTDREVAALDGPTESEDAP